MKNTDIKTDVTRQEEIEELVDVYYIVQTKQSGRFPNLS